MNTSYQIFQNAIKSGKLNCILSTGDVLAFSAEALNANVLPSMLSDSFCILFCKGGSCSISVNYVSQMVVAGDMLYLLPGMVVSVDEVEDGCSMEGVVFQPAFFDDLEFYLPAYNQMSAFVSENSVPVLRIKDHDAYYLHDLIKAFHTVNAIQTYKHGMLIHVSNALLIFVAQILQVSFVKSDRKSRTSVELYRAFRKLLLDNACEQHYIAFYADSLNVSPTYLSRVIRKVSGRSVNDHIVHYLLIESRRMLDCSDISIKQIAYMLGFSDQAAFGKFFKANMHVTPMDYRKKKCRI